MGGSKLRVHVDAQKPLSVAILPPLDRGKLSLTQIKSVTLGQPIASGWPTTRTYPVVVNSTAVMGKHPDANANKTGPTTRTDHPIDGLLMPATILGRDRPESLRMLAKAIDPVAIAGFASGPLQRSA